MSSNKIRILVTGSSSMLMQRVIDSLNKDKYIITGLSRKNQNYKSINWIKGDIQNKEKISNICDNQDIIIHGAAITHSFLPEPYFNVNYEGTKSLVDEVKNSNVSKFIFISSRAAELDAGAYGVSKLKAEKYIKSNLDNYLIFRVAEVFGGSKDEGVDRLIDDVLNKKIIFYPANVKSKLFPIFLDDCAKVIKENFDKKNETIYVNGNESLGYKEMIIKVLQLCNKRATLVPIPKQFIMIVKWVSESFKVNFGINPDQISRLYCEKMSTKRDIELLSLEEYLISKI